jgi:cytidine deaminase
MLKKISFSYHAFDSVAELDDSEKRLFDHSDEAIRKAYAVYSGFRVGAALLLANGKIISANNQENMAFPSSLCAERVLMSYCKANYPEEIIKKIAISVNSQHEQTTSPISPCGSCRQVMIEYERNQNANIEVLLKADNGIVYKINSVDDLLPLSFKAEGLKLY